MVESYNAGGRPESPFEGGVKEFNSRDALLRVRNRKPNKDAEHRVPIGSGPYAQWIFFTWRFEISEIFSQLPFQGGIPRLCRHTKPALLPTHHER
jgi:hypothetical protein